MNPTMKTPRRRARAGFTLIELLTVIAIVAILIGLTVAIVGFAQEKAAEKKTEAALAVIEAGLKRYYHRHGEYPEPTKNTGSGVEGAVCLYQALNDDGNDHIVGGGGVGSDGDAGPDKLVDLISEGLVAKDSSGNYFVKDGFDRPYLYMVYDEANPDATHQKTFDLWSYATDKKRNNEAKWVKNW